MRRISVVTINRRHSQLTDRTQKFSEIEAPYKEDNTREITPSCGGMTVSTSACVLGACSLPVMSFAAETACPSLMRRQKEAKQSD